MLNKRQWSVAVLVVAATASALALAQGQGSGMDRGQARGMGMQGGMMMADCAMMDPGMGAGPGGGMMMNPEAMNRLQLNDDQRNRMREMRREQMTGHAERQARMLELREDMHALMASERPDPEAVLALHAEMAEHRGQMLADQVRMRNQMHDMMNPEQREQMRQMQRQGGMQGRTQGGMQGGMQGGNQ